jgi:hypothetical protein
MLVDVLMCCCWSVILFYSMAFNNFMYFGIFQKMLLNEYDTR